MSGITMFRPYDVEHYEQYLDQAIEALLRGELQTKKEVVTLRPIASGGTGGVQFSATVSTFDNSQLETPAKVKIAQAADVAGDRTKEITIYGLDEDGVYQTEAIALDASNSTTPVESSGTYSAIFAAIPASALGAQDVSVYETSSASNVICTVPKSSAAGIMSTLAIPVYSGTFSEDLDYATDKGLFLTVTHVYNLTDDANRTTNLWGGAAFDVTALFGDTADSFSKNAQKVFLTTGVGSAKTYEVCGTYLPYQGVIGATSDVELRLEYKGRDIVLSTIGTGGGVSPTATVDADYAPISPKLPLTSSYADATMAWAALDIAGLTEYAQSTGLRTMPAQYMHASGARLYSGATVTFHQSAAGRGVQGAKVGGHDVYIGGNALAGSTPAGMYSFHLARVTDKGANAYLADGELVLLVIGSTATGTAVACVDAVDVFKLED